MSDRIIRDWIEREHRRLAIGEAFLWSALVALVVSSAVTLTIVLQ